MEDREPGSVFYGAAPKEYALYSSYTDWLAHSRPSPAKGIGSTPNRQLAVDHYLRDAMCGFSAPKRRAACCGSHGATFLPVHKQRRPRALTRPASSPPTGRPRSLAAAWRSTPQPCGPSARIVTSLLPPWRGEGVELVHDIITLLDFLTELNRLTGAHATIYFAPPPGDHTPREEAEYHAAAGNACCMWWMNINRELVRTARAC